MKRIKKILIRGLLIGLGICLIIIAITSTTGFKIKENPMENFFSQHKQIDSLRINDKIARHSATEDINFLLKTIEEVHPDPYFSITKERFHFIADSIKGLIKEDIRRKEFYGLIKPLIGSLNDGHTNVNFPEISVSQDNESNFNDQHKDTVKQIEDYRNTPIGENYVEIKGEKSIVKTEYQFNGDKYLLINSKTFSTALGFATSFKDNKMGIIIGEETNAEVNGFADIYPFDLPNSRLWVWCSTKMFIRPSGEMTKGGLKPDFSVKDEDDNIIEFTIKMINNNE